MTGRVLRTAAAAALMTAMAPAAGAWELRTGLLRQDAFAFWAAGTTFERAWALQAEIGFDPLFRAAGGEIAPMIGGSWAPGAEVDTAHAGVTWTVRGDAAFLRLGIGGVVHNGDSDDPKDYRRRRQFGSRVLFHVPAEVGVNLTGRTWVSAYYVHMSNADLATPNPGMDSVGVRVGWSF